MRELDQRAQTLMQTIDEKAIDMMKRTLNVKENLSEEEKKTRLKNIQELYTKAKEFGDDKVQLAIQTYELVDKHIRRLDSDLARFEGEIQDKTITSRGKSEEAVSKKGRKKVKDVKVTGKKKRPVSEDEEKVDEKAPKSNKKQKVTQEKEGRKAQKVNPHSHQHLLYQFDFFIFNFELLFFLYFLFDTIEIASFKVSWEFTFISFLHDHYISLSLSLYLKIIFN
jgi:hypothetical protein